MGTYVSKYVYMYICIAKWKYEHISTKPLQYHKIKSTKTFDKYF